MSPAPHHSGGAATSTQQEGTADWRLLLLLAGYCIWALTFILTSSVVVGDTRYFVLFDDAMVAMRYADNLASGHGLRWNPDEAPVEGITNLGWCLYMALLHLLPLPHAKIGLAVQLTGLLCQLASIVLTWRIGLRLGGGARAPALAAAVLTAFYLPLSFWCLFGLEVSLLCLLLCAAVLGALRAMDQDCFSWQPYLALAAATVVRPDAVVLLLAMLLLLALSDACRRRKHLLAGAFVSLLSIAGQTGFRLAYYGEPLPNTYYLKMTGYPLLERLVRGLIVLCDFLWDLNILLVLLPFLLLLLEPCRHRAMLATLVVLQCLYSVWVGGDAWEWWGGANRFIAVAMPLLFVLVALAAHRLVGGLQLVRPSGSLLSRLRAAAQGTLYPVLMVIALLSVNLFTAADSLLMLILAKPALTIGWAESDIEAALVLEQLTTPDASVAVIWAGTTPYFLQRRCIDMLGKSDRRVAHGEAHVFADRRWNGFFPGHMKWDFAYSIGERQPDVVVGLWDFTAKDQLHAMGDRYHEVILTWEGETIAHPTYGIATIFFLRKGSPNVKWQLLERYRGAGR